MGTQCPKCLTHQAFKRNITVDGKPARKQEDIVGYELACGHVIGGEAFSEFQSKAQAIRADAKHKMMNIEKQSNAAILALGQEMLDIEESE